MTFGQTLKQLLSISGVKSAHLARELGYDTSYISRWINDMKMPSLRNNDDLFYKISGIILASCDDMALERLKHVYLKSGAGEKLSDSIVASLSAAYDSSIPSDRQTALSPNALYLPSGFLIDTKDIFAKAIIQYASENGVDEVNCITTTPFSRYSNKDTLFWHTILSASEMQNSLTVIMHQLINMKAFSQNIDSYCAAICSFANYGTGVKYEFYKQEEDIDVNSVQFTCVEDHLLFWSMINPLSGDGNSFICSNQTTLASNYISMKNCLHLLPRILEYCSPEQIHESHFLYNYVMDGGIRYLLNIMHPIYMGDEFVEHVLMSYSPNIPQAEFSRYYNSLCAKAHREVVIFRSALLEYIYSGNIYLFGRVISLKKGDRVKHLEQLLENIDQGDCDFTILNDSNPLLCLNDMKLSLYLSRNTGFASPCKAEGDLLIIRLNSHRVAEYFNRFFEHLQELGPEYALSGSAAADFIRSGLTLI